MEIVAWLPKSLHNYKGSETQIWENLMCFLGKTGSS